MKATWGALWIFLIVIVAYLVLNHFVLTPLLEAFQAYMGW